MLAYDFGTVVCTGVSTVNLRSFPCALLRLLFGATLLATVQ